MATRITPEQVEEINELYFKLKVKAQVARQLGISASTVSKYIIPNYIPKTERILTHCKAEITLPVELFMGQYGQMDNLCYLSTEELEDLKELQKEVIV